MLPTSIEFNKQDAGSALNSLLLRHQSSSSVYERFAQAAAEDLVAKEFFQDLAAYRKELSAQIEKHLSDTSFGAHTPSKQSQTFLNTEEDNIQIAIQSGNIIQLRALAYENEKELMHYFRAILNNKELPEMYKNLFEQQAKRVQVIAGKVDRFKTVG